MFYHFFLFFFFFGLTKKENSNLCRFGEWCFESYFSANHWIFLTCLNDSLSILFLLIHFITLLIFSINRLDNFSIALFLFFSFDVFIHSIMFTSSVYHTKSNWNLTIHLNFQQKHWRNSLISILIRFTLLAFLYISISSRLQLMVLLFALLIWWCLTWRIGCDVVFFISDIFRQIDFAIKKQSLWLRLVWLNRIKLEINFWLFWPMQTMHHSSKTNQMTD